jgi:hypothetical protein
MYRPRSPSAISGTLTDDLLARARAGADATLKMVLSSQQDFSQATCQSKQGVIKAVSAWLESEQSLVVTLAGARSTLSDEDKLKLDAAISQLNASIKVCQTTLVGMQQAYVRDCSGVLPAGSADGSRALVLAVVALGITAYFVLRKK